MPQTNAPSSRSPAGPAKARLQKFVKNFEIVVDALTEAQSEALIHSGVLSSLDLVLTAVRTGQLAKDMTVQQIAGVLTNLAARFVGTKQER